MRMSIWDGMGWSGWNGKGKGRGMNIWDRKGEVEVDVMGLDGRVEAW